MTPRVRVGVFLAAAAALAAVLAWGLAGVPSFGDYHGAYGPLVDRLVLPERHTPQAVIAVTFDVRGFDTMGEEFVLFAAAAGVAMLLREVRDEPSEHAPARASSDAIAAVGVALSPPAVLLGLFVVAHGLATPGGGFQGGVVLAGALALVYLAGSYRDFRAVSPAPLLDLAEGLGVGAYTLAGLAALAAGGAFLENIMPLGAPGKLGSGGTMIVLNAATGLEVAGALVLLATEFLEDLAVEPEASA